ncbi:MAG: hypothetical protein JWL85_1030 [Candidatus Saccharibacteria bacterium]|nr:hypothetical protein [Candidatus Saccharibacteria bacterium]
MLILTLRTDKPESELGLFDDNTQLSYEVWHAHRELAETLHKKIADTLQQHDKQLSDLEGLVVYKGPGSFTGLRIGMSVANALAYSLGVPIIAKNSDDWTKEGLAALHTGENDTQALPEYGAPVFTTAPRK